MSVPGRAQEDPIITVRVPTELDDRINEVWKERGYQSRSEFIRDAIRTAIDPQITVSEEFVEHLVVSQRQRESGESISLEDLD